MRTLFVGILIGCVVAFTLVAEPQSDGKLLPTDDEIRLVLLQTERAIRLYKPLVDEQAGRFGGEEMVSDDRKTMSGATAVLATIKTTPQSFNGPDGFELIEMIRALEHSGASCSAFAATTALNRNSATRKADAVALVQLSVSCTKSSVLFRTVGDNAAALFTRFLNVRPR